jgi:hypothetical protein
MRLLKLIPPSLETMKSFVCYKDLFDELTEIHGVNHCKGRIFYNRCKEKYANVTQEVTKLFTDTCQLCVKSLPRKKPTPGHTPILTRGFGSQGQVDLIDFQTLPDGEFKFLMNYTDAGEKFGWSIPLTSKRASSVALRLVDIFTVIGPPSNSPS